MNQRVLNVVARGKIRQYETFASRWIGRIDPELLPDVYNSAVSAHQSKKSGTDFEHCLRDELEQNGIPVYTQVPFKDGVVVSDKKGADIVDLAIAPPGIEVRKCKRGHTQPAPGIPVDRFIVLSSKISSRERKKLDRWTLATPPRVFYYCTATSDYPDPSEFGESSTRKIVTAAPRSTDTRSYKLTFDDLVEELRQQVATLEVPVA